MYLRQLFCSYNIQPLNLLLIKQFYLQYLAQVAGWRQACEDDHIPVEIEDLEMALQQHQNLTEVISQCYTDVSVPYLYTPYLIALCQLYLIQLSTLSHIALCQLYLIQLSTLSHIALCQLCLIQLSDNSISFSTLSTYFIQLSVNSISSSTVNSISPSIVKLSHLIALFHLYLFFCQLCLIKLFVNSVLSSVNYISNSTHLTYLILLSLTSISSNTLSLYQLYLIQHFVNSISSFLLSTLRVSQALK